MMLAKMGAGSEEEAAVAREDLAAADLDAR